MEKKLVSWDDIPSLEGLGVDWDFEPENPLGKRAYVRLTQKELYELFLQKNYPVKLVTEKRKVKAFLVDISQGGVSLHVNDANWKVAELVKLGFFLGNEKIISRGSLRNVRKEKGRVLLGVEFIELPEKNHDFIAGLYSSLKVVPLS